MHSNQQTIAGLFPDHTAHPELDQVIREAFRGFAAKLGELLPTNPNATFAFRTLRQAMDAALLAATDSRNSSSPLPTGPASPSSASSSASTSSSTPPAISSSTPAATSSSTPAATPATRVILGPDGAPITPRPGQGR